jgi:hypothetical protein
MGIFHLALKAYSHGFFMAPFMYNSKWACGNNHMLSHPVRAILKIYAIRGLLWSYIHLFQGYSRIIQVDTLSSLLWDYGIFFRASSKVDINDNQFSNNLLLWH